MFRGTVKFRARIVDTERGLTIPQKCEFKPNKPGVEKVEIECPDRIEIVITVHFSAVNTEELGITLATEIHNGILDRISMSRDIAIENGRPETAFSPANSQPNVLAIAVGELVMVGYPAKLSLSLSCPELTQILEEAAPTTERFGLFRSALLSTSPVEKFMHLYNILLMFFHDDRPGAQGRLDDFIRRERPGVPQTPHPLHVGVNETVYTRLRNELGHHRKDSLDETKAEMAKRLGELIALTKRAIESPP